MARLQRRLRPPHRRPGTSRQRRRAVREDRRLHLGQAGRGRRGAVTRKASRNSAPRRRRRATASAYTPTSRLRSSSRRSAASRRRPRTTSDFLDKITDFRSDDDVSSPHEDRGAPGVTASSGLFPYQRSGIQWLNWLFEHNLHGLLADDMGLGKTLQSLVSMRYMYEEAGASEPSLIICPVAVMRHWEKEISRRLPPHNRRQHLPRAGAQARAPGR